jgi:8-oxo-dGTP diphosphatase
MENKGKSRGPILAAGGIVLRNDLDFTARFAVVQSRKLHTWGLPKGKLAAGEDALTAARREVLEETGQRVAVHEFLGTLVYETSNRPKVVQFWRMEAEGPPDSVLMRDVKAVHWLALRDAIGRLSHLRERVFLQQVGPIALKLSGRLAGAIGFEQERFERELFQGETDAILVPDVPLAPADEEQIALAERAGLQPFHPRLTMPLSPAAGGREHVRQTPSGAKSLAGKSLIKKTWGWFRHAALSHRQPFD